MAMFVIFIGAMFAMAQAAHARSKLSADERNYGPRAPDLVCPRCGAEDRTHARPFVQAGEFSGWKLAAAVFTGGLSLLAVGVHRHATRRRARCAACLNAWIA